MVTVIKLGSIEAEVLLKDIKNVHLSVHPPSGRVRIAAPKRMKLDTIRVFAISKLSWIRQQQKRLAEQDRETRREYLDRESHYLWGKRYLLSVAEKDSPPKIMLKHSKMVLSVRPGSNVAKRHEVMEQWYREQLRRAMPELIERWEPILKVKVRRFFVQRMRTRWGSCNPRTGSIRLNTDLAKKPRQCLEYIVVHEMVHLLEPTHNHRFVALMDRYMPHWQQHRQSLNRLPVRHENWEY
ncbi:MAG: SprT family zinc-dependent metalloprotease [Pirellulaceae bacterium]